MTCPASWRPRGALRQVPPHPGQVASFSDVSPRDWFALWVDIAYNVGLTSGVGKNRYAPNQTLTVAEALKLAATIESRYQGDDFHLSTEGGPYWYVPAVDYCLASGMIQKGDFTERDYGRAVTRRERRSSLPPPVWPRPCRNSTLWPG